MTTENKKLQIVIENRLYDVTKFSKIHPGGDLILENFNDCDVTDYFYAVHSNQARKMLKNMPSTEVADEDKIPASDYVEMSEKLEAQGYFNANYWVEAAQVLHSVGFLFLATYYARSHPVLASICLGIGTLIGGWIGHQMDHQRNNAMRKVCTFYAALCDGLSINWWATKHNRHHLSTNETDHDGDIQLFPFIYLWKPKKEEDAWNRSIQHIYFSVLYTILQIKWQIDSIFWAFSHKNGTEIVCLILHWIWYFCLPWQVWLAGVLIAGTISAWVVTASHQSEEKLGSKRDLIPEGVKKSKYQIHDYVAHQVITTRNIDMNSWVLNYVCGGMQYQIEHHIFPRIPLYKLPEVKDFVMDYCKKRGLDYNEESLWQIMKRNYMNIEHVSKLKV